MGVKNKKYGSVLQITWRSDQWIHKALDLATVSSESHQSSQSFHTPVAKPFTSPNFCPNNLMSCCIVSHFSGLSVWTVHSWAFGLSALWLSSWECEAHTRRAIRWEKDPRSRQLISWPAAGHSEVHGENVITSKGRMRKFEGNFKLYSFCLFIHNLLLLENFV